MKYSSTEPSQERRSILKAGFWGTVLLGSSTIGATLTGCATAPAMKPLPAENADQKAQYHFLTEDDLVLLSAISPVIISGQDTLQPSDSVDQEKLLADIDAAIHHFSDSNKKEVRQLFDLLNFAPTRGLLGGVWSSWDNATAEDIEEFLNDWRYSSLSLLNKAYAAIIKIVGTSWYIQKENWHLSGYPGPPAYAVNSLPQFQK